MERLRGLEGRLTGISATYSSELAYGIADRRGHLDQARQLLEENQRIAMSQGLTDIAGYQNNMADLDRLQGRYAAAQRRLAEHAEAVIEEGNPYMTLSACETMAAVMGPKHPLLSARAFGCASTTRLVEGIPHPEIIEAEEELVLSAIRALVDEDAWETAWERGRGENIVDLFREMAAVTIPDDHADVDGVESRNDDGA